MRFLRYVLAVLIVAFLLLLLHHWWTHGFQHRLAVVTGTVNESGPFYGFWSGFGSDLGEGTLVVGVLGLFRAHNCHAPRCWRLGKHSAAGGTYKLCRHHHPDLQGQSPTLELIHRHHHEHRQRQGTM